MEEECVPVDNFTCSIMMKGLRHSSASEDVDRTLNLIQRAGVCPDEVCAGTVLCGVPFQQLDEGSKFGIDTCVLCNSSKSAANGQIQKPLKVSTASDSKKRGLSVMPGVVRCS